MNPTYLGVPFVLPWNNHTQCHADSVDRFPLMGNRRMILTRALGQDTGIFGANGLLPKDRLGLLSVVVGLLRSCVEYQEVIQFPCVEASRGLGGFIN